MIGRLLVAAAVAAAVEALLAATGHGLHPVEITLLVAVAVLLLGLVVQLGDGASTPWPRHRPEVTRAMPERRLAAYTRMVESNQTAAKPDPLVRDLLRRLVDERLARRRGLTRADPAAAELLGPDLVAVLDGAPARIRPARLSAYLDRIEAL